MIRIRGDWKLCAALVAVPVWMLGCSEGDGGEPADPLVAGTKTDQMTLDSQTDPGGMAVSTPVASPVPAPMDTAGGGAGDPQVMPVDAAPSDPAPVAPVPSDPAPVGPAPSDPGPMAPAPVDPAPMAPAGPNDGDPSAPVYVNPDVPCTEGGAPAGFSRTRANFMLDGRDMIVTYPCNKHGGAPMTFILNLHGTTPVEQHFYQHGYFKAHQFADSHNLIVVTPSAVGTQWGRSDNGEDEPHLMNIIEWVYSSFAPLDIRAMWVAGHSWGGAYTSRFGCKEELADRVKGLVIQSGGGVRGLACADRVSVIISSAEGDPFMPEDQSTLASSHGCGAAQTEVLADINDYTYWPDCDPGFVHANYYMREKEHATYMDIEVVESIVDWIQLSRQ